jgi:tight adherence protein B
MLLATALILLALGVALATWLLVRHGVQAWTRYEGRIQQETRRTLDDTFLFLDPAQLWPAAWLLGVGAILLAFWLGGRWWAVLPVLAVLPAVPPLVLRQLRRRREARFDAQLPDLVQALAGALRAGAGVQPALQHIVMQSLPPLSQEFSLLLREQRMGLGFSEALAQLRLRMPTEACGLVVSALEVAARTGGSLADTLEGIAQTLRARQHWMGRVRALTAQGRLQSHIMAGLPMVLLVVLSRLEPEAMALLWSTGPGGLVLLAILALEVLGLIWIRRVAAIEV